MDTNDLESYSAEQIWARLSEAENEEKFDLLKELYDRSFGDADYSQAASLAAQAAEEAKKCMSNDHVEKSYYNQGLALWRADLNDEAIEAFTLGTLAYQEPDDKFELGRNQWGIAASLFDKKEYESAAKWAVIATDTFLTADSFSWAGFTKFLEAKALNEQDLYEEALASCEVARGYRRREQELQQVADIDGYMASIHSNLGNTIEAVNLLRNCLVLVEAVNSPSIKYFAYRLGNALADIGEYEEARVHLERARQGYTADENHGSVADCFFSISLTYRKFSENQTALELARSATSLWDAVGNDHSYVRGLQRIAVLLYALENYTDAIENNRRIVSFAENHEPGKFDIPVGWAQLRIIQCYQKLDLWEYSIQLLEETTLFGKDSSHPANTWFYSLKARALYHVGNHEEALGVADTGLSLTLSDDVDEDTAFLYEVKAKVSLEQNRPDKERHLAHAIALLLAFGETERARELSDYFKPDFSPMKEDNILGDSNEKPLETAGEEFPGFGFTPN
jgi:tetratricopeptide (TPR) repeat protein